VAALEAQLAATKEGMEAEMRERAAEADALRAAVAVLRGAAAPTLAESEAALAALQARLLLAPAPALPARSLSVTRMVTHA
jgi:hypothetical protein